MRVHWDAFRLNPLQWLAGVWWHVRGKRVRARSRIEPLLGASPSAYRLALLRTPAPDAPGGPTVPIGAVIDCTRGADGLDMTMRSVEAAGFAFVVAIGRPPGRADDRLAWLDGPAALPDWLRTRDVAWICPIRCGDLCAADTPDHYGAAAARAQASVLYADDDLCDSSGQLRSPHLKPRWNAELFRHHDYLSGAAAWQWEPVADQIALGLDQALAVAVARATAPPEHLPLVLHHRRGRPAPRRLAPGRPPARPERVSIIVPTRNQPDLLRTCLTGVDQVAWNDVELIIVDNGSDDPAALTVIADHAAKGAVVIRDSGPFNFSRLNNLAVERASGSLLCLLNNDVETQDPDWLAWLVAAAQRDDVGAVGAQLLYPDRTIQHAGVVLGVGGGAAHAHRGLATGDEGYFQRHRYPQYVSAVTGACLMVRRERFLAVGGLDEREFAVAFNDVDLCLKLNARGWQSFFEPRACLIHHESKSRGLDRDPVNRARFAGELAALKLKWDTDRITDPYHHPRLSRYSDQFVLAL